MHLSDGKFIFTGNCMLSDMECGISHGIDSWKADFSLGDIRRLLAIIRSGLYQFSTSLRLCTDKAHETDYLRVTAYPTPVRWSIPLSRSGPTFWHTPSDRNNDKG